MAQDKLQDIQVEINDDDEPLEKVKEKPPPGINGSLIIFYAICFTMFAVGWTKLNKCPINIMIPIYLIVTGFGAATAKFLSKIDNRYAFYGTAILITFDCLWNILGTYWVFKEYQPDYDEVKKKTYCDRTAYLVAFWSLIIEYTLLILFLLISGCYMMMRGDFKKK